MSDRIATFCERHGLPWDDRRREQLATYVDLLLKFNDSMNLIGPMDRRQVVGELILDSLAPAVVAEPTGRALDVGTGAGLPGLPLAILFPETRWTLVEPRRKRQTFLKIARQNLELDETIRLARARVEELDDGVFDYLVAKAFRPPDEWIPTAAPLRKTDGRIVCMTRPDRRADVESTAGEHGLEVVGSVEDTAEIGVPETETTRAIYVVGGG